MALASLIFFLFLAAGSLVTVSMINKKEKHQRIVRHRLNTMKLRVEELEELVLEIELLVETRAIPSLINEEIITMLEAMIDLDEQATYLNASLSSARSRAETLNDESEEKPIDRLKESDAQIAKARRSLEEGAKVLRQQQQKGRIDLSEMNSFIEELSWANLMVETITFVGQGHKALNRSDVLSAHAFYKKAQQVLMQTGHPDQRRHRMIKELSEMLSGMRRSISEDLMPENQFNPDESTPASMSIDDNEEGTPETETSN